MAARAQLGNAPLVTTHEVLTEFLTALSRYGPRLRAEAAKTVRDILSSPNVTIAEQTSESFLDGLTRYERRLDKAYSLQDCISMNIMEAEGITEILTGDHHFEQEGFMILMRLNR